MNHFLGTDHNAKPPDQTLHQSFRSADIAYQRLDLRVGRLPLLEQFASGARIQRFMVASNDILDEKAIMGVVGGGALSLGLSDTPAPLLLLLVPNTRCMDSNESGQRSVFIDFGSVATMTRKTNTTDFFRAIGSTKFCLRIADHARNQKIPQQTDLSIRR